MEDPYYDSYMCPNCCTPWKCNGPHIPEELTFEEERAANWLRCMQPARYSTWLAVYDCDVVLKERHSSPHWQAQLNHRKEAALQELSDLSQHLGLEY